MRAIGIDPGTAITGYGIVEDAGGALSIIACGAILTPAEMPMPERLLMLHKQLRAILALHAPETAAVERLFFQKNVRTALSVGQARGIALLALAEARIPIGEYTPLEVKQAITGYGGADKRQIQQMVKTILVMPQVPQPDDAADALAIAICHLQVAKFLHRSEVR